MLAITLIIRVTQVLITLEIYDASCALNVNSDP